MLHWSTPRLRSPDPKRHATLRIRLASWRCSGSARSVEDPAFGRALSGAPAGVTKALLGTSGVAMTGGSSLVFGTERRTSALDAALVNAAAAVAGSEASRDAANSACIVALFGLCEERGRS